MVELVRAGRTPEQLAKEFEPSAQAIRNWVAQADRDEGRREDGLTTLSRPAAALQIFFWAPVSINIEKRCNHYRLIVACMLSGVSRDRPVIVGWSTALRGQVINEKSRATPEETGSRPARAGKDRNHPHPIGDETVDARSLGEVGTTSVHSKPVFACNDCTFLDGIIAPRSRKKQLHLATPLGRRPCEQDFQFGSD